MKKTRYEGIYLEKNEYYTKNLTSGSVYGEKIIRKNGEEYRHFSRRRSKLSAYLSKGGFYPFKKNSNVLYIGAGKGTTLSHISDICHEGRIYAVEFSRDAMRELCIKMKNRKNVFPVLADARFPERYRAIVCEVDIIYQDVAQRGQPDIFLKNARLFLRENGCGIIMVKGRSIDISRNIKEIFSDFKKELEKNDVKIRTTVYLNPYHKDHAAFAVMM